jgi:hypothetical protein
MRAFGFIKETVPGQPAFDRETYPYHGHAHCASLGEWGAYLISGTRPQLTAINALPEVVGICLISKGEDWAEIESLITAATRTKINNWLTARDLQPIPSGWTNRRVVVEIFKRLHNQFDLNNFWIAEP